jgi:hypothetical protein
MIALLKTKQIMQTEVQKDNINAKTQLNMKLPLFTNFLRFAVVQVPINLNDLIFKRNNMWS